MTDPHVAPPEVRSAPPRRHSTSTNTRPKASECHLSVAFIALAILESVGFTLPPNYTAATLSPSSQPDPKTHPAPDLRSRNRTKPPSPLWHLSSESLDPSMPIWSQSHPDSQTQARQSPPHPTSPARAARAQTKPSHADACPEPSQQAPQTPQATSMSR